MKKLIHAIAITTVGLLSGGCASTLSYQDAMDKNRRSLDNMDQVADAQFLVDAMSFNLLESRLNQLAIEKGYSATVVSHAKKDLERQEDLQKEIAKLARKEKMKVPGEMKSEHSSYLNEIEGISRADFDSRFVDLIKRINEENEEIFEDQASKANDADIRAFAARKLDMFKTLDQEISKVDDELMDTRN